MAAQRPSPAPRRPRHGSLERPISGRTYRGTALLVAIPLLIAAFSVGRPDELPPASIPGQGSVPLQNVYAVAPGRSRETLVVMAHRDNLGVSPGANDNASGTGALLELARGYGLRADNAAVTPAHTIVFLSTDGGAFGGLGAERFVERSPYRNRLEAVLNLTAIGGRPQLRIEIGGGRAPAPPAPVVPTAG